MMPLSSRVMQTSAVLTFLVIATWLMQPTAAVQVPALLLRRSEEAQCLIDFDSNNDICAIVQETCPDFDQDGLIPYLRMYACTWSSTRPIVLAGMVCWLLVLLSAMATTASEHLATHLEFIVCQLGLSESWAGMIVFAFGNGCTDLFATIAAMNANSGSLAISELFGAAAFITTVVLGIVTIVQSCSVDPRVFGVDVIWFALSASVLVVFLADGRLVLVECVIILSLYVAFAAYVTFRANLARRHEARILLPAAHADDQMQYGSLHDSVLCREAETALVQSTTLQAVVDEPLEHERSTGEQILMVIGLPLLLLVGLTIPSISRGSCTTPNLPPDLSITAGVSLMQECNTTCSIPPPNLTLPEIRQPPSSLRDHKMARWLQSTLGLQLLTLVIIQQTATRPTVFTFLTGSMVALLASILLESYALRTDLMGHKQPHAELLLSILSFVVSLVWLYLIATSAVSLLMTLALLFNVPTALLGATVFAVGQSSNDLVANAAVAKRGMPVLAASATLGGPMMNMFLGIGGGGLAQVVKSGAAVGSYTFLVGPSFFLSAANLLLGLAITFVYGTWNRWFLDKRLGTALIAVWSVFAIGHVVLSIFLH